LKRAALVRRGMLQDKYLNAVLQAVLFQDLAALIQPKGEQRDGLT